MEKDVLTGSEADSYEFIFERDAKSIRSDSTDDYRFRSSDVNSSSVDSGIPLNPQESALAKRVRDLKLENKELRSAIDNYQEVLQLCQDNLDDWNTQQQNILKNVVQKHRQAREQIEKLQKKIVALEEELRHNTKPRNEEESVYMQAESQEKSVKLRLEGKVLTLCERINKFSALSADECGSTISPGSDFLKELVDMCIDLETSIKSTAKVEDGTEVMSNNAMEEDLKMMKARCDELEDEVKHHKNEKAELIKKNDELQDVVNCKRIELKDVENELKLLNKDMERMDMVRAGCVSRDSEMTEESFLDDQKVQQSQQSVDSSLSLHYETTIRELKAKYDKLKDVLNSRESYFTKETEKVLKENKELKNRDMETHEIRKELEKLRNEKETLVNQLTENIEKNTELKAQLIDKNSLHFEHLQKQETIEHELKAQVYSFYEELQAKESECKKWQERIESLNAECSKMNSALAETRKELAVVYAENEKLVADQKVARGAEAGEYQSTIDNLTAQLLSAEEMLENKEQDYRKLQSHQVQLASELETVPLLKQQLDVFQADFNTERQTRQKVEDDCRKLRDEVAKLRAENERLVEETVDPTGSRMAEMQRRHGCGSSAAGESWTGFFDNFLAPRGPPASRAYPPESPLDGNVDRQVSGGRCPKCNRMFPDLDTLQTHVVECLESESTQSVGAKICPKCLDSFPDLDTLQIHVMECLDK